MTTPQLQIRSAVAADLPTIWQMIQDLAAYEKLSDAVEGSAELLREHLFGEHPYAGAILAELESRAVGLGIFFYNYSTFLTRPGIYLEDLYVQPDYRRRGIGKALLQYLAKLAVEKGCGRLEWTVLDWNASAIAFYESLGATVLPDWRVCRVNSSNLTKLANL